MLVNYINSNITHITEQRMPAMCRRSGVAGYSCHHPSAFESDTATHRKVYHLEMCASYHAEARSVEPHLTYRVRRPEKRSIARVLRRNPHLHIEETYRTPKDSGHQESLRPHTCDAPPLLPRPFSTGCLLLVRQHHCNVGNLTSLAPICVADEPGLREEICVHGGQMT